MKCSASARVQARRFPAVRWGLYIKQRAGGRSEGASEFASAEWGLSLACLYAGAGPGGRRVLLQAVSTRILGRRTAPFPPFLIPNRVPHGFTQDMRRMSPELPHERRDLLGRGGRRLGLHRPHLAAATNKMPRGKHTRDKRRGSSPPRPRPATCPRPCRSRFRLSLQRVAFAPGMLRRGRPRPAHPFKNTSPRTPFPLAWRRRGACRRHGVACAA